MMAACRRDRVNHCLRNPTAGIGRITPVMKLKMVAQNLRIHPVKNGGLPADLSALGE